MDYQKVLIEIIAFYKKYKKFVFFIAIICISVVLILQVVLPQLFHSVETRRTIEEKETKLKSIRASLDVIKNINGEQLDSKVEIVQNALPSIKDFVGIFLALSTASSRANVEVGEFSLSLGRIYSKKEADAQDLNVTGSLTISLSISATSSNIVSLNNFASELQKVFPLAEVKSIGFSGNSGSYAVVFYYKPYNLASFSGIREIKDFSKKEEGLLQQLIE